MLSCDVFIVTVPTPIDDAKKPDLNYLAKASELVANCIKNKNCKVIGADKNINNLSFKLSSFYNIDLDKELPDLEYDKLDYILLLDVIEHIKDPEEFMRKLYIKVFR